MASLFIAAGCSNGRSQARALLETDGAGPRGTGGVGTIAGNGGATAGNEDSQVEIGPPPPPAVFPLVVSSNGRYLQDQNGTPFLILGDGAWQAPLNLNTEDQTIFLNDRVGRHFNSVLFDAIEHKFTQNKPPKNLAGDLPFTKRLDGHAFTGSPNGTTTPNGNTQQYGPDPYSDIGSEAPDFTSPNETYWASIDAYVALCATKGVLVLTWPAYAGYGGADEGWMSEMVANDAVIGAGNLAGQSFADNTKSKLWNYAAWLADRYKNATNIVWVYGGDYGTSASFGGFFGSAQKSAVSSVLAGSLSVGGQKSTLRTAHWARTSLATDVSFPAGSFDVETVYSDLSAAGLGRSGYSHTPVLPAFQIETYYENNDKNQNVPNRRLQWWGELSAIGGYFFGNEKEWPFASGWQSTLTSPGSLDTARENAFFTSIAWQNLVPSGLNGEKTLITDGGGTANPQSMDYVAAAATTDGTLLVAYIPPSHSGSITVDMSAMSGTSHARWFDPTNGNFSDAGSGLANSGTHPFTPPGNNASGAADWVLLVNSP